jgi:hypothetical protein
MKSKSRSFWILGQHNEWKWILPSIITLSREAWALMGNGERKPRESVRSRFLNSNCVHRSEEVSWEFCDYFGKSEENCFCLNNRSGRIEKHAKYIAGRLVSSKWSWVSLRRNFLECCVRNKRKNKADLIEEIKG